MVIKLRFIHARPQNTRLDIFQFVGISQKLFLARPLDHVDCSVGVDLAVISIYLQAVQLSLETFSEYCVVHPEGLHEFRLVQAKQDVAVKLVFLDYFLRSILAEANLLNPFGHI